MPVINVKEETEENSQCNKTDSASVVSPLIFHDQETQQEEEDSHNSQESIQENDSQANAQCNETDSTSVVPPLIFQDQETQQEEEDLNESLKENDSRMEMLKEIAIQSVDLNVATCSDAPSQPISLVSKVSFAIITENPSQQIARFTKRYDRLPFIVINSPTSRTPITIQPSRAFPSYGSLISPMSLITASNQPQSLFLQALAKLNQSSISLALVNKSMKTEPTETEVGGNASLKSSSLYSPPDSLTSAPPSYSFVLRQQSAARRRPRLMGTFIPSPSFVQRTPPPTYAAAFDIYVDTPIAPPHPRAYSFGFTAMPVVCPECGYAGLTSVTSKITLCTHLCALLLCLFCCWICAPLPYVMRSCKDVYHYCRNCRNYLGMYSPSNPETPYPVG